MSREDDITRPHSLTPADLDLAFHPAQHHHEFCQGQERARKDTEPQGFGLPQAHPFAFAVTVVRRAAEPGRRYRETTEVEAVFLDGNEAQDYLDAHSTPDRCTITTVPLVGL